MKIAIIGSRGYPYVYSGYETFVKELVERLVRNNIEVTVYCHKNLFNSYPSTVNRVNLVYFNTIEKKTLSQFIHSFQSMIHACFSKFDIILVVNSANGPFGLISKILNRHTVINVDGLEWLRPKWKGLGGKYFYWASKLSTKLFDEVVTDSFEMKNIYQKEFNANSTVIAYGANIQYNYDISILDKKYNIKPKEYYLIVGRLIPDNNADLIVKEFMQSKTSKKLVIVGDVPYQDNYAQIIRRVKDERIIFTGYITNQENLGVLFGNCFVYLHGHQFGGTNPTMLTAMANGCAIFALDTVFNREMCCDDKHALYFTKDEDSLSSLIDKNEQSPNKLVKFRQSSRERITSNYTWDKITQQYIDLFKKMLESE